MSQDLPLLEDPAVPDPPIPALVLWVGDALPSHTCPAYMFTWADTFDPTGWGSVLSPPLLCSVYFDICMNRISVEDGTLGACGVLGEPLTVVERLWFPG